MHVLVLLYVTLFWCDSFLVVTSQPHPQAPFSFSCNREERLSLGDETSDQQC